MCQMLCFFFDVRPLCSVSLRSLCGEEDMEEHSLIVGNCTVAAVVAAAELERKKWLCMVDEDDTLRGPTEGRPMRSLPPREV